MICIKGFTLMYKVEISRSIPTQRNVIDFNLFSSVPFVLETLNAEHAQLPEIMLRFVAVLRGF